MRANRPQERLRDQPLPYPWSVEGGAAGELAVVTHDGGWHRVVIRYDPDTEAFTVTLEADDEHPHAAALDEPLHTRHIVPLEHVATVVAAMAMFADFVDPFTNPHSRGYTRHLQAAAPAD